MLYSIKGTYKNGVVELYDKIPYDDEVEVIITFLAKAEQDIQNHQITKEHLQVQQLSLGKIWDNPEEDVYGEL
ncbi:hypothetical protein H8E77_04825 [bacterium]|nr:hypothetical protein [bacterium]